MRIVRMIGVLIACALVSVTLSAQFTPSKGVSGTVTAVDAAVTLTTAGYASTGVQVTGTFSATLAFEGTTDGSTWVAISATPVASTTTVTSVTSTGAWSVPTAGLQAFRVRCSAYTSGTPTVALLSNQTGARGGGGAGGGGAPSTATYITQTADSTLTNEQALGSLATGLLKSTTTTGVVSIGVVGDVTGLFTGSCPSGATCVLGSTGVIQSVAPFPYSYQRGSFLGVGLGSPANTGALYYPGGNIFAQVAGCAAPASSFWQQPTAGVIRNVTTSTSAAVGQRTVQVNAFPCGAIAANNMTLPRGGVFIPPGSAAGGFVNSWSSNPTDYWHLNQYESMALGFATRNAATTALIGGIGAEFLSDDGTTDTVLSGQSNGALTASASNFLPFGLQQNATEVNTQFPIPVAGTMRNLLLSNGTSPTSNVVITLRKNAADTALTTTIAGGDAAGQYGDMTHSVSVVAGDLVNLNAATGATTQTTISSFALLFVPGDSSSAILWGSLNNGSTVSTTPTYAQPFSAGTGTTEAAREYVSPIACTVSALYVNQATANGGTTVTTFTLRKNEADTALTGTIGVGVTGAQLVSGATSVAIVQGDRLALKYVTNTGTSGTMSAWAAKCL